jgi:hypothetical protein
LRLLIVSLNEREEWQAQKPDPAPSIAPTPAAPSRSRSSREGQDQETIDDVEQRCRLVAITFSEQRRP